MHEVSRVYLRQDGQTIIVAHGKERQPDEIGGNAFGRRRICCQLEKIDHRRFGRGVSNLGRNIQACEAVSAID